MADSDNREPELGGITGEQSLPPAATLDALAQRIAGSWANRIVYGTLLVAVSIGSAILVSPGLYSQKIPELRNEDVGKPFRAASLSGFKASHDYEVVDEAKTVAAREQARNNVRPVFDYDPSVQSMVARELNAAFEEMQDVVDDFQLDHFLKGEGKGEEAANGAPKKRGPETKEEAAELTARLRDARKRIEQHVLLTDTEDFDALVANRFSAEAQKAALSLVEVAYRSKLVTSRDELSRVDSAGITVRILGGSSEHEIDTRQSSAEARLTSPVLDLREAADALDRFAGTPGNMLPGCGPGAASRGASYRASAAAAGPHHQPRRDRVAPSGGL